jgi:glycosyltransferase involved in cell wall biosynthesis
VGAAWLMDAGWRLLARSAPTIAVGSELAARYRGGRAPVLETGFSLVRADELVAAGEALAKPWDAELRVLSVGRLDPEKNPLLLIESFQQLRARHSAWRLVVAGDGTLRAALERAVAQHGLDDAVELLGNVANGAELWELYRSAHAFLHVSLTEGLPQVLFEAQAAGLPVVATDVGGVAAALDGGRTGLLVPPRDAGAIVDALERLRADPALRERLIVDGLASVAHETLDAQLDRFAEFLRKAV